MKSFSQFLTEAFLKSGYILNGLDYEKLSKENLTSILKAIKENKKRYVSDAASLKTTLNSMPLKFGSPREFSKLQPLYDAMKKTPLDYRYYNSGYDDQSNLFNNAVCYNDSYYDCTRTVYSKSDSCEDIINAPNDKWKFFFAKCYGKGMKTNEIVELKNLIVSVCKEFSSFPKDYLCVMDIPNIEDLVQAVFKGSCYISKKNSIFSNASLIQVQSSGKLYVDNPQKPKPTFLYGSDVYFGEGNFSSYFVKANTIHDAADKTITYAFTGVYKAVVDMETGIPETINYGLIIRKADITQGCKAGEFNPKSVYNGLMTNASPDELKQAFNSSGKFVPYDENLRSKLKTKIVQL